MATIKVTGFAFAMDFTLAVVLGVGLLFGFDAKGVFFVVLTGAAFFLAGVLATVFLAGGFAFAFVVVLALVLLAGVLRAILPSILERI
ncbi:MAG: hypothetical protein JST01_17560 [Cyanobacteria bacterium SZAS TMP-1]|nr:hypothetical protein [Cyanobacteria bacterium SZAS TMP-1]